MSTQDLPEAPAPETPPDPAPDAPGFRDRTTPTDPGLNALIAGMLGSVFGIGMAGVSVALQNSYGWALFIFTPLLQGLFIGYLVAPYGSPALASVLSIIATVIGILLVNLDGLLCVIMAAPIVLPLVLVGALSGKSYREWRSNRGWQSSSYHALSLWVLAPALAAIEARYPQQPPLLTVTSEVRIAAPPQRIWDLVIAFPRSTAPPNPSSRPASPTPAAPA